MDGNVRAVVVEDSAGAVDDFLVALDLRHDLLLHIQRRQGDLVFQNLPWCDVTLCSPSSGRLAEIIEFRALEKNKKVLLQGDRFSANNTNPLIQQKLTSIDFGDFPYGCASHCDDN